MNKITQKDLNSYYSLISRSLICSKKQKAAFLGELKTSVEEYLCENEGATAEDVYAFFGTPAEIAGSFMENNSAEKLKKGLGVRRMVFIALAVALLIYLAFIVISLIDVHSEAHGYMKQEIMAVDTVITRGGVLQ